MHVCYKIVSFPQSDASDVIPCVASCRGFLLLVVDGTAVLNRPSNVPMGLTSASNELLQCLLNQKQQEFLQWSIENTVAILHLFYVAFFGLIANRMAVRRTELMLLGSLKFKRNDYRQIEPNFVS